MVKDEERFEGREEKDASTSMLSDTFIEKRLFHYESLSFIKCYTSNIEMGEVNSEWKDQVRYEKEKES